VLIWGIVVVAVIEKVVFVVVFCTL